MRDRLQALADAARREISVASEPSAVEALRIRYLGKKGELSGVLGGMGKLPPDERRALGEVANQVKAEIEKLLADAVQRAEDAALEAELRGPKLDVTLPGRAATPGSRHPVSRTMEEIVRTFQRLGFEVAHGPEIRNAHFLLVKVEIEFSPPIELFSAPAPFSPRSFSLVKALTESAEPTATFFGSGSPEEVAPNSEPPAEANSG